MSWYNFEILARAPETISHLNGGPGVQKQQGYLTCSDTSYLQDKTDALLLAQDRMNGIKPP